MADDDAARRAQQRDNWRKALATAAKAARTQRHVRKQRPGKAGMNRKAGDGYRS